ncbi:hypothetical protein [Hanstruepera flava]|uniref:hypothetical protein n=1 Tax=Hanstruepera flava TaxID=2930218 RepID=UPI0020277F24|nr:hypothetical protein [Hanstruepera flava]
MSQNICVISFDHWNYDHHIVDTLNELGYNSNHLKIDGYQHASFKDRITNVFSKVFRGKNLKKIRRQEYIIDCLKSLGKQDQILVINPEVIDKDFHLKIKTFCTTYMAYLYDSLERHPVEHLFDNIFDKIYSFDKEDIKKHNLIPSNNYIYLPKQPPSETNEYNAVYVGSLDDRLPALISLAKLLKTLEVPYKFLVIGKKRKLKPLIKEYGDLIQFDSTKLNQKQLIDFYSHSQTIVDLIRDKQTGLSFRFFEAMALSKKIITNNANVKNYPFYSERNIFILDNNKLLNASFFEQKYEQIDSTIYEKYTLKNWVKTVFNL